jgi:uncharacterized integral membrane protein
MVRLVLLLLVIVGLAALTLQNLTPVAIVVLGAKTQALPLSVWVLSAIGVGGLTTLVLSGFSFLSKNAAVRRVAQRSEPARPWSAASRSSEPTSRTGFSASRRSDDWEAAPSDTWDDWEPPQPRQRPGAKQAQTEIRDQADDWQDWQGYEDAPRRRDSTPRQTDFEVRRPPASTQQSGSVYSYSYREPQDAPRSSTPERSDRSDRERPMNPGNKTNEVYDAEYRVLIPPYSAAPAPSTPSTPPPSSAPASSDDDWGDLLDDAGKDKR